MNAACLHSLDIHQAYRFMFLILDSFCFLKPIATEDDVFHSLNVQTLSQIFSVNLGQDIQMLFYCFALAKE